MTALASTHHRHRKPPLHRRAASWARSFFWKLDAGLNGLRTRRQRRQVEAARDEAYVVRIEAHAVPPLVRAQARMAALFGALHHEHAGFGHPPAAVLPDEADERWPHLNRQWSDDTGTFTKISGDQS